MILNPPFEEPTLLNVCLLLLLEGGVSEADKNPPPSALLPRVPPGGSRSGEESEDCELACGREYIAPSR